MDQWLLVVTSDPAAKGLANNLEVAGAGPVHIQGENGSGAGGSDPY